ncbi:unnamed protein product [Amoebophrya sp. A120]|nr:unnamed protein product [Amoebophrya sp. A120]|eukprot:GSA120T00016759001.1
MHPHQNSTSGAGGQPPPGFAPPPGYHQQGFLQANVARGTNAMLPQQVPPGALQPGGAFHQAVGQYQQPSSKTGGAKNSKRHAGAGAAARPGGAVPAAGVPPQHLPIGAFGGPGVPPAPGSHQQQLFAPQPGGGGAPAPSGAASSSSKTATNGQNKVNASPPMPPPPRFVHHQWQLLHDPHVKDCAQYLSQYHGYKVTPPEPRDSEHMSRLSPRLEGYEKLMAMIHGEQPPPGVQLFSSSSSSGALLEKNLDTGDGSFVNYSPNDDCAYQLKEELLLLCAPIYAHLLIEWKDRHPHYLYSEFVQLSHMQLLQRNANMASGGASNRRHMKGGAAGLNSVYPLDPAQRETFARAYATKYANFATNLPQKTTDRKDDLSRSEAEAAVGGPAEPDDAMDIDDGDMMAGVAEEDIKGGEQAKSSASGERLARPSRKRRTFDEERATTSSAQLVNNEVDAERTPLVDLDVGRSTGGDQVSFVAKEAWWRSIYEREERVDIRVSSLAYNVWRSKMRRFPWLMDIFVQRVNLTIDTSWEEVPTFGVKQTLAARSFLRSVSELAVQRAKLLVNTYADLHLQIKMGARNHVFHMKLSKKMLAAEAGGYSAFAAVTGAQPARDHGTNPGGPPLATGIAGHQQGGGFLDQDENNDRQETASSVAAGNATSNSNVSGTRGPDKKRQRKAAAAAEALLKTQQEAQQDMMMQQQEQLNQDGEQREKQTAGAGPGVDLHKLAANANIGVPTAPPEKQPIWSSESFRKKCSLNLPSAKRTKNSHFLPPTYWNRVYRSYRYAYNDTPQRIENASNTAALLFKNPTPSSSSTGAAAGHLPGGVARTAFAPEGGQPPPRTAAGPSHLGGRPMVARTVRLLPQLWSQISCMTMTRDSVVFAGTDDGVFGWCAGSRSQKLYSDPDYALAQGCTTFAVQCCRSFSAGPDMDDLLLAGCADGVRLWKIPTNAGAASGLPAFGMRGNKGTLGHHQQAGLVPSSAAGTISTPAEPSAAAGAPPISNAGPLSGGATRGSVAPQVELLSHASYRKTCWCVDAAWYGNYFVSGHRGVAFLWDMEVQTDLHACRIVGDDIDDMGSMLPAQFAGTQPQNLQQRGLSADVFPASLKMASAPGGKSSFFNNGAADGLSSNRTASGKNPTCLDFHCVKFHPTTEFFAAGVGSRALHLYDLGRSGRLVRAIPTPDLVAKLAFSMDGLHCYTAMRNGSVCVYDLRQGLLLATRANVMSEIYSLESFGMPRNVLGVGGSDGFCYLDLENADRTTHAYDFFPNADRDNVVLEARFDFFLDGITLACAQVQ